MMKHPKTHRLIERALDIRDVPAQEDNSLTFMARIMAQATLPHSDPGNVPAWVRTNGDTTLIIQPGVKLVNGEPKSLGLPYGSIPRLLMSWVTAEALRTKNRKLILGDNLSDFMEQLDLVPSGGRRGDITRFKNQMNRLFQARISFEQFSEGGNVENHHRVSMEVAPESDLWWDYRCPEQKAFWTSWIELGEKFYKAITDHPVPIDFRVLKAIKQSPLALDLYIWLTYRMSYLRKTTHIPWTSLKQQFGSDYKDLDNFVRKTKATLRKIKLFYPALNIDEERGRLVLLPSKTHIAMK